MNDQRSKSSAAEQGLGYIYQARLALLKILSLPESSAILLEKDDDIEFVLTSGTKTLGSLKHKAIGDKLTNLSTDFWKSVNIWLDYYATNDRILCEARFVLFSTAQISEGSFLKLFIDETSDGETRAIAADEASSQSKSDLVTAVRAKVAQLSEEEQGDFFNRITVADASPRITAIRDRIIDQHLRTIRKEVRHHVYERLEGWWFDTVIQQLSKGRQEIFGHEVSDKLVSITEEYKSDNLPITFRGRVPAGEIDADTDPRIFVRQLRAIELPVKRIQHAIIDYYRAFEQRSSWARENLLISGEIEEYENRLVEEWSRYKEIVCESVSDATAEAACVAAGKELYQWAEMETSSLRIRERVTEPYVVRGTFQMLANVGPIPRVHWHPHFLKRLSELMGEAA